MANKQQKLVDGGDYLIPQFYGLHTAVKNPREFALGEPQDSLNFITGYNTKTKTGDNIQLRLGSALLAKTRLGAGKISAMAVGLDVTGKQWPFFAAGGKAYYYNSATGDIALVTNGTFTATEDMTMEFNTDLFGPYMITGSPNTGINAISIANKTMTSLTQNNANGASGYMTIRQNFMWVWNYINPITNVLYRTNINQSNPDQISSSGTGISNPQGSTGVVGNGVLKTFSGTIASFSPLAFSVQIGVPINTMPVTSFNIPAGSPFSSSFNISIVYTGGFQFNTGDYVVVQGSNINAAMNDCIGIVQTVSGNSAIAVNFILTPTLVNTAGGITGISLNNGGTGYTVGDVLSIGGSGGGGTAIVSIVSSGVVTAITLGVGGAGYSIGSAISTTGGTGTGATVNISSISGSDFPANTTLSKLELFEDDINGNLKSTLGSTGTINYVNGVFTLNTNVPVPNGLNIDSIAFTGVPGILTFAPGSWQQNGGPVETIKFFNNQLFSFHTINTWLINLGFASASTTTGTNGQQQFRQNMGIPYFRAAYETGDGILFIDYTEQNNPKFRELAIIDLNTEPDDLSDEMDFSSYIPTTANIFRAGNFDFLSMQSMVNGVAKGYNDTTFLRNNISGFYDKTDLRIACTDSYNGTVIAGDPISQNLYALFNGADDDGAPINAYWTSGLMNLGSMGLKQFNFFHVDGFIGVTQVFNVLAQYDAGSYVLIGTIYGNGKYVDMTNSILVGQGLAGTNPIGGLGNGQLTGYYFTQDIPVWTPLFQYVSIKFVPGIDMSVKPAKPAFGALQINGGWGFRDTRIKTQTAPAWTIGK